MAIIFNPNNTGTGTLSPPDLLDIENIFAPVTGSIEISSENDITLSPQANLTLAGNPITLNSPTTIDLTTSETINLNTVTELNLNSSGDTSLQGENTYIVGNTVVSINAGLGTFGAVANSVSIQSITTLNLIAPLILFSGEIYFQGKTTAQILAIASPQLGSINFNTTLNQLFYYQVSPITGLVLGWYNSTGNIKL